MQICLYVVYYLSGHNLLIKLEGVRLTVITGKGFVKLFKNRVAY